MQSELKSTICEFEGTSLQEIGLHSNVSAEPEICSEIVDDENMVTTVSSKKVQGVETVSTESGNDCDGISSDDKSISVTFDLLLSSEDSDNDDPESLDSTNETANDSSQGTPRRTQKAKEEVCMAILSLIARHCITTEAAKDVIDLLRVLCPENDIAIS